MMFSTRRDECDTLDRPFLNPLWYTLPPASPRRHDKSFVNPMSRDSNGNQRNIYKLVVSNNAFGESSNDCTGHVFFLAPTCTKCRSIKSVRLPRERGFAGTPGVKQERITSHANIILPDSYTYHRRHKIS